MNRYPIIIGGFYRSGTSLLRRLLDAHSNIHCGPEVKFFKDLYSDYLSDELAHVRFFSTMRTLGLSEAEILDIFGKAFVDSHQLAASKVGKVRWADKNPENVLYLDQWCSLLGGEFFFIHVVRHPLDAIDSLIEVGFKKAVPSGFEEKIELYQTFLQKGLSFAETHADSSVLVRYEDMVKDPRTTLTRLLNRVGEEFEATMLEGYNSEKRQKGIEDPKVAHTGSIHGRSVGRWRSGLRDEQVRYALRQLVPIMSKFGYDMGSDRE